MKLSISAMLVLLISAAQVALAAPINPNSVAGLTLWLQSNKINGVNTAGNPGDGGLVPQWTDSNAQTYAPTQGTSTRQPTYQVGSSPNGVHAGVQFDGVDDHLRDDSLPNMTASTIITAFRTNEPTFKVFYHNQSSNSDRWGVRTSGNFTGGEEWHILTFTVDMSSPAAAFRMDGADAASVIGPYHVYDIPSTSPLFGYSTPNTAEQILHVGSPSISSATNSGTTPMSAFYSNQRAVGAYLASASEYFDGEIGEMIVYNSVLSLTDIQGIEEYLLEKFVTPLPPVPEPSTGLLATITGAITLITRRRKREA